MAEKKAKSTAAPAAEAPEETIEASTPAAKPRRPARLAGKEAVPSKTTAVSPGCKSQAVTQAEKARGASGAKPSPRATPSTTSSYGTRLRPQDTPLHRRRPASAAGRDGQEEKTDQPGQAAQEEKEIKEPREEKAPRAKARTGAGKAAKAKAGQASEEHAPKAPAFDAVSLDREDLPDGGDIAAGGTFPAAQDAEGASGQETGQAAVQESPAEAGALPWEADDGPAPAEDKAAGQGRAKGKAADGIDARSLFGQDQAEGVDGGGAEPGAEGSLPWERREPASGGRNVDARSLFGQKGESSGEDGEGPVDTKSFFTRAGAEDLRIDYGSGQASAEDGVEAGTAELPGGSGMAQDKGPAVSLERLAGAKPQGAEAPLTRLRRAGQAKAAEAAKSESAPDPDRPKIRRSQASRQEQPASGAQEAGVHEGRVYRDARRARDGQRVWSAAPSAAPVTMSAAEMAETAAHGGSAPKGGSFRGLVENLQGGAVREEPKRRDGNARIISVPSRPVRGARIQQAAHAAKPAAPAQPAAPAGEAAPAGQTPEGRPRVLICWLGKVDVGAAMRHDHVNPGPVRMLIEHSQPFDRVVLLTTQNANVLENYRAWLAPCVAEPVLDIRRTQVHDLADHGLICPAIIEAVEQAIREYNLPPSGEGIVFHLSPGTPATHAMLLLLATNRYKGVRLVQTKINGAEQASEVLDIRVPDVVVKDAADSGLLPAFVTHEPLPMPEPAAEEPDEGAEPDSEADSPVRYGRGARGSRKRPAVHAYPARAEADIDPYEGLRRPTNAPNMQAAPEDGDPPTISAALGEVYARMQRISTMPVAVLLLGESGTGKSRLARFIHEWSGRTGKYVSVDCAGLTDEMFTAELFGQKQGDYPAAWRPREGAVRLAHNGTIFLENVEALTPTQQSMLLRVLAPTGETVIQLPGPPGSRTITSRVRIVASASDALVARMQSGEFRADLFYRLAGVAARLPAVREYAPEEKENLLRSFFVRLQHKLGKFWSFSGEAWQALLDEDWPGNLREVSRMLQQICLLTSQSDTISREDVLQQLKLTRMITTPSAPAPAPAMESALAAPGMDQFGLTGISADGTLYAPGGLGQIGAEAEVQADDRTRIERDFFALGSGASLEDRLQELRMAKITEALNESRGNRTEAARLLGLSSSQLADMLHQKS